MFHIALYEPEIPANTGNIMRLCANTGATLHLIHPLGFHVDAKTLKRAGMDYRKEIKIKEHLNFEKFLKKIKNGRLFACTTKANVSYNDIDYQDGDVFLFGPESRGLPPELLDSMPAERKIKIPMRANSRSLNLSNAVAVIIYEAWRQLSFRGRSAT